MRMMTDSNHIFFVDLVKYKDRNNTCMYADAYCISAASDLISLIFRGLLTIYEYICVHKATKIFNYIVNM